MCLLLREKQQKSTKAQVYRVSGLNFIVLVPKGYKALAEAFVSALRYRYSVFRDSEFGTPSIACGYALRKSNTDDYNDVFYIADSQNQSDEKPFLSSGIIPAEHPMTKEHMSMETCE